MVYGVDIRDGLVGAIGAMLVPIDRSEPTSKSLSCRKVPEGYRISREGNVDSGSKRGESGAKPSSLASSSPLETELREDRGEEGALGSLLSA